jgi:imidazolonepropionase-like amidohydrolase
MKKILLLSLGLLLFTPAFAQQPAKPQARPVVLSNATIHIGNGQVLENAALRFENGIITEVGSSVNQTNAEVINASRQHIYPGLILPYTTLGLNEVGALRPTQDVREAGEFNPNVRALVAYNTDSELIGTTRSNGVLIVQPTPGGGLVSGTSSVMQLEGWNWEDAVLRADDGVHINWVSMFTRGGFFSPTPGQMQKNENRGEALQELDNIFKQSLAYTQGEAKAKNLKFEAMRGLFDGSKTLYIHVDFSREIVESVQFAQKHQVKKIVVVGANDALDVADFLRDNQIPVIIGEVHRLPNRSEEEVWLPYQLPALLKKAGILVSLAYDNEPMRGRNLPFLAGTAAAYGLSKEDALMMITANTAKILGIDDKVGTLEKGKHATLVISQGDILDMRTNQINHAFIQGKKLDLSDKHKQLYEKFKAKYPDVK